MIVYVYVCMLYFNQIREINKNRKYNAERKLFEQVYGEQVKNNNQ